MYADLWQEGPVPELFSLWKDKILQIDINCNREEPHLFISYLLSKLKLTDLIKSNIMSNWIIKTKQGEKDWWSEYWQMLRYSCDLCWVLSLPVSFLMADTEASRDYRFCMGRVVCTGKLMIKGEHNASLLTTVYAF